MSKRPTKLWLIARLTPKKKNNTSKNHPKNHFKNPHKIFLKRQRSNNQNFIRTNPIKIYKSR